MSRISLELVTIRHQLRQFLYRRRLLGGNGDGVNTQGGCDLGMPELHLRTLR
ncbi:MAG: hypothetical protein WCC22_12260 [Terriglobales bacterium]